MSDLWNYFKNIFGKSGKSSAANPFTHEVIALSDKELSAYEQWKSSDRKTEILEYVHRQYGNQLITDSNLDRGIDFLNTPSSKGFVIHCTIVKFKPKDLRHFFFYLHDCIKSIHYRAYLSDRRTYEKNGKLEMVERHYLKPPIMKEFVDKVDQKFGNITIELVTINQVMTSLKFQATSYNDHLYAEAERFEGLMEILC